MNLNRVYVGFTKDGEYHLFYTKDMSIYCDLENSDKFYYDFEIDKNSLVRYSDVLKKKFGFKRKVINHFKLDSESKLKLDRLVVAVLRKENESLNSVEVSQDRLFENIIIDNKVKVKDLIDNNIYDYGYICGKIYRTRNYICNWRYAREALCYDEKDNVVVKKKILERNYKKYN